MAEKTLAQLAIGYTGMAASVSIGAYLASQLLVQLFRAYRLRKCREQAEAEAKALCESPRQFTPEELARHDGRDPRHCLFIAVKGRVLDVHEAGAEFYGPEGPYKHLAGRDGSRALALMSLKQEDATDCVEGLSDEQKQILDDWAKKLYEKYPTVGRLGAAGPQGGRL